MRNGESGFPLSVWEVAMAFTVVLGFGRVLDWRRERNGRWWWRFGWRERRRARVQDASGGALENRMRRKNSSCPKPLCNCIRSDHTPNQTPFNPIWRLGFPFSSLSFWIEKEEEKNDIMGQTDAKRIWISILVAHYLDLFHPDACEGI